jgi:hypothetical protein
VAGSCLSVRQLIDLYRTAPSTISQTMEEMRAQTAHLPQTAHTASNVTLQLPADFSFLRSPRYGDDDGVEGDGLYGREREGADQAAGELRAGSSRNVQGEFWCIMGNDGVRTSA